MLEIEGTGPICLLELNADLLVIDLEDSHHDIDRVGLATGVSARLSEHQLVLCSMRPVLDLVCIQIVAEAAFDEIRRIHREEKSLLTFGSNVVVQSLRDFRRIEHDLLELDSLLQVHVAVDAVTVVQLTRLFAFPSLRSFNILLLVDDLHSLKD